jgi:glucosyl-dolichyl phosphate glucuronosyltransferase
VKYTVLITTYNRAHLLEKTLRSMATLQCRDPWEVIIVDNNSSDDTRAVVERTQPAYPVPLAYLFEPVQGKPAALNTGIRAARGGIIVMTDDDVAVEPDWLDRCGAGFARFQCDYVGGRVLPMWERQPPRWIPERQGRHWAVLALLDFGPAPVEVGYNGVRWPLGANMAVRRDAFDRVGLWDNDFGRRGTSLRGQEQREWCLRARAAGLHGYYLPDMVVHHHVPKERLDKRYFRRWSYWNGVSRALLYDKLAVDMESPDDSPLDFSTVPHLAGVPRYMWRTAGAVGLRMFRATLRRDQIDAFEQEMRLWFFAGVVRQRWQDRGHAVGSSAAYAPANGADGSKVTPA